MHFFIALFQQVVGRILLGGELISSLKIYYHEDMLLRLFTDLSREDFEALVVALWSLWNERNVAWHRSGSKHPARVRDDAGFFLYEFQKARSRIEGVGPPPARVVRVKWERPSEGCFKLNVDAAVDGTLGRVGVGRIIRDWNGCTIAFFAKSFAFSHGPYTAELFALREALSWCRDQSLSVKFVESDCLNAIKAINSQTGLSNDDILIGDIQYLFADCGVGSCCYVARESNKVAHTLAKLSLRDDFASFSSVVIQRCITQIVPDDLNE
ncbi:Ribonuclease H-like domain containing protein [Trema orientale]|uniref:Ribonuclease H-like domain containing protein n=1 Tax=Trema orientale TaxID=63057 RepID=A0A2P5DH45_TREOI|nr:Ribonuclease H-like domain containing protein [Trema orientale]